MHTPSQFYAQTIKDQIQKDNLEGYYYYKELIIIEGQSS